MSEVYPSQQHFYSRVVCINTALAILCDQQVLHRETTHPEGRLYGDIILTTSLHHGDFLLAAMIICLAFIYNNSEEGNDLSSNGGGGGFAQDRKSLIGVLQRSHEIFKDLGRKSADSQRVCDALTIMLRRVNNAANAKRVEAGFSPDDAAAAAKISMASRQYSMHTLLLL